VTNLQAKTEWWKDPAWVAVLLSAVAIIISIRSCQASDASVAESKRQHEENLDIAAKLRTEVKQDAKAKLVVSKPRFAPEGVGVPTIVGLFNEGSQEAIIERISFRLTGQKTTPDRETLIGKGPTVPVNFTDEHYDATTKTFSLVLRRPSPAPGQEWTSIEVAIVQPAWLGKTYTGVLTVEYDGNKSVEAQNVEIDVLKETPPPPNSP
jgi:hypothetical protein